MQSLELKIPPVVVFLVCLAGMWGVARLLPRAEFVLPYSRFLAAALTLIGVVIGLAGVFGFRRERTTVHPSRPEDTTSLVATGIYRFTRNPMYLGLACCLLAWAFFLGNAAALPGVIAFFLYMTRFQIKPEERVLRSKFGAVYAEYSSNVRRWL